jgi:hypothetical protein
MLACFAAYAASSSSTSGAWSDTRNHTQQKPIPTTKVQVPINNIIVLIFELDDHTNGTEDLFLDDLHGWVDVSEDGGSSM